MARAWRDRAGVAAVVVALLVGACGGDDAATSAASGGTSGTSGGGDSSGGTIGGEPPLPVPSATCEAAPTVEIGRYSGTLRGAPSDAIGVCGDGGPLVFVAVEVPERADLRVDAQGHGFGAGVAVYADGCAPRQPILCASGGPLVVPDLRAGSVALVAVGAAADDPAIDVPPPAEGPDPLSFTLDVGFTRVLGPGDACGGGLLGRCAGGTLCLPPADDPAGATTCRALDGDTCAAPEVVAIDALAGVVSVEPGAPQTDAHVHSCGGGGERERVLRLAVDDAVPAGFQLEIEAPVAGVGLAVRAPGCAVADEIACAAAGDGGAAVVIDEPALYRGAAGPYVFVELDPAVAEPFELAWSLSLK